MRLLLATDGSEYSETAAKFLTRFNWSPQDSILVFHAIYALPFPEDLKFYYDTLKAGSEDRVRIAVYCDPVHLKDTKTLSRVDLSDKQDKGVARKNAVLNVVIELTGPASVVEGWAKGIATDKVLAQVDGK